MKQNSSVPPDASAALYFLPGQYLFATFCEEKESLKALSCEQVCRAFRDIHTDTGWLDGRVVRYREAPEGNAILAYQPASVRNIFVEFANGRLENLTLPLPTLILLGKGKDYFLWASTAGSVSPKTRLAVAPLPNIGGMQGKICFGRNEVPEIHPSTLAEVWRLIFETPFNHDNVNDKCVSEPTDVRNLLVSLAQERPKKFPNVQLLTSSTTVDDAWAAIIEQRRNDSRF
jgi:PRTRC genetic system protein B